MTRNQALAPTLFDTSRPSVQASLIVAGACLTTLASQIQIPWQPVPFTLQTLAVMVSGLVLGSRLGALSQIAYLGAGAVGLPVFAGFRAGLGGPTTGYLLAFGIAAWIVGWCAERGWDRSVLGALAALAIAQAAVLALGTAWLSFFVGGMGNAWKFGVAPFLVGEGMKSAAIVLGVPCAWKLISAKSPG